MMRYVVRARTGRSYYLEAAYSHSAVHTTQFNDLRIAGQSRVS